MLGMGGTIASEISEDGLVPEFSPEQLLDFVPEISEFCDVETKVLFSIDSSNSTPYHSLACARAIEENYDDYDGFVITHGTDTLAYTAATLSYLIQGSRKPIILTGAQKPIHFDNTDSKINLFDAFIAASSDSITGVNIVFNGSVIIGTRARKTRSKHFNAFSSVNYPIIASIQDKFLTTYITSPSLERPIFYHDLNTDITLVKLLPLADSGMLKFALAKYKTVIVESFGVGGLPSYPNDDLSEKLDEYLEQDNFLILTTQVPLDGSDIGIYSVGHNLKKKNNILEAYDMTTESAFAKAMWILAQTKDPKKIRELFYTPVAMDLFPHASLDEYI